MPIMAAIWVVPELLESVLLFLDMTTLLVSANRVCKSWHNLIDTSPALRKALYFDADLRPPRHCQESQADGIMSQVTLNPLLVKFFSPCFFDFAYETGYRRRANSFYSMPWVSKPRREGEGINGSMEALPQYPKLDPELSQDKPDRQRFTRKGASWRRMLVSQPPPRQLGYLRMDDEIGTHPGHPVARWFEALINPHDHEGLRMGQLYDVVQQSVSHHPRKSRWFRVFWGQVRGTLCDEFGEKNVRLLMRQTGVVIDLLDLEDRWQGHCRDPMDPEQFDEVFQCDEAGPRDWEERLVATNEYMPGLRRPGLATDECVY